MDSVEVLNRIVAAINNLKYRVSRTADGCNPSKTRDDLYEALDEFEEALRG